MCSCRAHVRILEICVRTLSGRCNGKSSCPSDFWGIELMCASTIRLVSFKKDRIKGKVFVLHGDCGSFQGHE